MCACVLADLTMPMFLVVLLERMEAGIGSPCGSRKNSHSWAYFIIIYMSKRLIWESQWIHETCIAMCQYQFAFVLAALVWNGTTCILQFTSLHFCSLLLRGQETSH